MTEKRITFFFKLCLLVVILKIRKIRVMIFWLHRTVDQQGKLYQIGRHTELDRKPVTNCDGVTKRSKHQDWLAADLVIVIAHTPVWNRIDQYKTLGKLAKMVGLRWGGDWDGDEIRDPNDFDIYHVEFKEAV